MSFFTNRASRLHTGDSYADYTVDSNQFYVYVCFYEAQAFYPSHDEKIPVRSMVLKAAYTFNLASGLIIFERLKPALGTVHSDAKVIGFHEVLDFSNARVLRSVAKEIFAHVWEDCVTQVWGQTSQKAHEDL